jgi:dTDP-glucose pyrophosphorylase
MRQPTLIVMAAGMGTRYGGLKQLDPVGPHGEVIMDYSLYDALRAGFGKVVFVIRKEMEVLFRERIGHRMERLADTHYVFQEFDALPAGFAVPAGRVKPWGTAHAILVARDKVDSNFGVINADDYYGRGSFQVLADFLHGAPAGNDSYSYALVGFILANTLTEHGSVARGVCAIDDRAYLVDIKERSQLRMFVDGAKYHEDDSWQPVPEDSLVSMNMWGFTTSLFSELDSSFNEFLAVYGTDAKAELFIPTIVDRLVKSGKATVKILPTDEQWFGVTYQEDRPQVKAAIKELITLGRYPDKLWT